MISAINTANSNNQGDTIILAVGGTYNLTAVDNPNSFTGDNGLPIILSDNGNSLTIDGGSGATIQRVAGSPKFRIFQVSQGANVSIGGVTIKGGDDTGGSAGGGSPVRT